MQTDTEAGAAPAVHGKGGEKMNVVVLIGRLVKDPVTNYTPDGTAVSSFTLAVNRPKTRDGKEQADFIRCIAFNKTAEVVDKYVRKGRQLAIHGQIHTGHYEKDGRTYYTTDVIVNRMEFTGKKEDNTITNTATHNGFNDMGHDAGQDEDIPF
ncbi:single-stranded DNA-binding protein [Megasphaera hominis]|uniref:Single-stranded DNA-binding protein n=2 Tax=Megasphaera hominis TaxID=159836 RepID=A0ABR6VKW9_9FIRM|nr:single-stranded DNA-binding protein [Megasphaera hominis]